MRYILLNQNNPVLSFDIQDRIVAQASFCENKNAPIGFSNAEEWLENRKASKHNHSLRELMRVLGCDDNEGFISLTHATSLNDTFWVKREDEDVSWQEVSLYDNPFNEVISKMAMEGYGFHITEFSSTSPELTTEGSFKKCWKRIDNDIYLFKRGTERFANAGMEPYCEVLASQVVRTVMPDSVRYSLGKFHGNTVSICKLFTSESVGYVPASRYFREAYVDNETLLNAFREIGSETDFRTMVVLDSVILNSDRHRGNFGFLVDNESQELLKMAPVFDLNMAMLPYAMPKEGHLKEVANDILNSSPAIGDDFIMTAKRFINDEVRDRLSVLKDFSFGFRGNDAFPKERICLMEDIVHRQLEAVLDPTILRMKDVYGPFVELPRSVFISHQTEDFEDLER